MKEDNNQVERQGTSNVEGARNRQTFSPGINSKRSSKLNGSKLEV